MLGKTTITEQPGSRYKGSGEGGRGRRGNPGKGTETSGGCVRSCCYSLHALEGAVQAAGQPKAGWDRKQQLSGPRKPGPKKIPKTFPPKLLAPAPPPPVIGLAPGSS